MKKLPKNMNLDPLTAAPEELRQINHVRGEQNRRLTREVLSLRARIAELEAAAKKQRR